MRRKILRKTEAWLRKAADKLNEIHKRINGTTTSKTAAPRKRSMSDEEIEHDRNLYIKLNDDTRFLVDRKFDYICKNDKYAPNANLGAYFIQDIWGARKVLSNRPSVHYDVGSRVDGFIAQLIAGNQKTVLIDIRKANKQFDTGFFKNMPGGGISYICADATHLDSILDESIESLSALCSVEHFGLGRYSDPISPNAWESALKSFQRVLKKGGRLYLSVPIGHVSKVCFNAHRVFRPDVIIETLDLLTVLDVSYISGLDTIQLMERKGKQLITYNENFDSMPDLEKNGVFGLFEFIKR